MAAGTSKTLGMARRFLNDEFEVIILTHSLTNLRRMYRCARRYIREIPDPSRLRSGLKNAQILHVSCMPGFVWMKTTNGARTAGFFAFQASDGKFYASDSTTLDPPPGSVILFTEELITSMKKSSPKGIYVCTWTETRDEWYRYLLETWDEDLDAYLIVDSVITNITDLSGIPTPRNSSKGRAEEGGSQGTDRAAADKIDTALQLSRP